MILTRHPKYHSYFIDGQPAPSVTQIVKAAGLAPDFDQIDPAVLEKARARGIAVHAICEAIDKGQTPEVTDETAPYRDAYVKFVYESGAETERAEAEVYHPSYLYAGTYDWRGRVGGERAIIDRKATYTIHHQAVAVQCAAYRGAHNALHPDEPCPNIFSLHLRRDGTYRLHPYDADEAWSIFLAALSIYRFKKRVGKP